MGKKDNESTRIDKIREDDARIDRLNKQKELDAEEKLRKAVEEED
jgi:hypothetical protein